VTFAGRNKRSAMRPIRDGRKKGQHQLALYVSVRPAGRTYLEVQVLYSPDKGKS
jgi:hypothetical protein